METLAEFFTSKTALGIFSSAMLCLVIIFARNMDERIKSERKIINAEVIANTLQRISASPWGYKVRLSLLDRQPAVFVFHGETSKFGQIFVLEDEKHPEYRRLLHIPCVVNGGFFEIKTNNPAFIVFEKRDSEISLGILHALDAD